MLRADRLHFTYEGHGPGFTFDLTAPPGEITAVRGSSGSGKSTLLELIAGFQQPISGTLTLDGADMLGLAPEERPMSIVFQTDTLFDHLSAERNVALGLPARLDRSVLKERVAWALTAVGLPSAGQQLAATLSGGQKQRVALARTLLRDRPVLLLDEPFSALDEEARAGLRVLVLQLTRERSWHTVLVSHHAEDIAAVAERIYVLENGGLRPA